MNRGSHHVPDHWFRHKVLLQRLMIAPSALSRPARSSSPRLSSLAPRSRDTPEEADAARSTVMEVSKRETAGDVQLSGLSNLKDQLERRDNPKERSEKPAACTSSRATNSENAATSPRVGRWSRSSPMGNKFGSRSFVRAR